MFPKLGMGELVVILLIVVVLFGAARLPQLGEGLGKGIRSFKKAFGGEEDEKTVSSDARPPDQGSKKA